MRYEDFDLADGTYPREPHPLRVWTQSDGQWGCIAYDHGPFCRRCVKLDETSAALLSLVLTGELEMEDHPDLGWRFQHPPHSMNRLIPEVDRMNEKRPRQPTTEAGRTLARQSLGEAVTIDQILDIEDQAATEFQTHLLWRFDHWRPFMTDSERGAVAGVLFVVLPEELTDAEREAAIARGKELIAQHPEWLAGHPGGEEL